MVDFGIGSTRSISQSELSAECWLVQMSGLDRCLKCEFADTDECGGKDIRKTGKNEKGFKVPLGKSLREIEIEHAIDFLVDRKFEVIHSSWSEKYVAIKGNFRRDLKDADDLIEFVQALDRVQSKDFKKYASWKDCWGGGFE